MQLGLVCTVLLVAFVRLRKVKLIFVPDFKRGLRFVNGTFVNEVGPGTFQIAGTRQHIEVVDMRPQSVLLERTFFRDAWKNTAFISISAEALVADAHLASTVLKNQIEDSLPIARSAVGAALCRSAASEDPGYRTQVAADVTLAVNKELAHVGMKIQNVEILEFWLRPFDGETTGVAQ
jgi:hypothetical protein